MNTRGLSLDQAPPITVPAGFFALVPAGFAAAGIVLLALGEAALATGWSTQTLGLAHLGTLGVLGAAMLGALYQMIPVVAGAPVPRARLAHVVQISWALGVAALVFGLMGSPLATRVGMGLLGAALALFVPPVGLALLRAPGTGPTVQGMRVALLALLGVAGLGLVMAAGHAGLGWVGERPVTLRIHVALGLLGWVGGLLTAVSWQVVPMFYLAEPVPKLGQRLVLAGVIAGVLAPWVGLWSGSVHHVALGAAPAALAVFVLHPVLALRSIHRRRRRRSDASLRAWQGGLVVALVCAALCWPAHALADPRWALLLGWLSIAGWGGLIVHGMLSRVVPFLVWFHRFSALAGLAPVPSMKDLLPDRRVLIGLALHAGAVVVGAAAIGTGSGLLARVAGGLLVLTGAWIGLWLIAVLSRRPAD
ncbi:MAG TPA: hypothetical protein QGF58_26650 [Myxococcota bacterium]|nr:hypothetical protein [Myxococcota bacterium]